MEGITLQQTINEIAQACAVLDNAKSDFQDVTCAALDAFNEANGDTITKADRKNIVKIAKAMSKGKKKDIDDEAASLEGLLEQLT